MNDRFLCFRTTPSQPLGHSLRWKLPFFLFSVTLGEEYMSLKVPKFKEFQVFFLWSNVMHSTCIETLRRINIRAHGRVFVIFYTPKCESQKIAPFRRTSYFFSIPGRLLSSKLLSVVICCTAKSCNNCILSGCGFPCLINIAL